jgi:hypothetical protein
MKMTLTVNERKLAELEEKHMVYISDMTDEEFKEFMEFILKKYRLEKVEKENKNDN